MVSEDLLENALDGYFIGIDSGTQSTKAILLDAKKREVVGEGSCEHKMVEGLPTGYSEQEPEDWIEATQGAIRRALQESGVDPSQVKGIGVSGQQHGFVALDEDGKVIRPAMLWNDVRSAAECEELISAVGGKEEMIELTGNGMPPGFTASKILWLKKNEPESYAKLVDILLPHNYINYWLTGEMKMERGDASGTNLLDVGKESYGADAWVSKVMDSIDAERKWKLPPLQQSHEVCGKLTPEAARALGLSESVIVSTGGGDNMMGGIGTGNVEKGIMTVSFGTSGTIYAFSDKPIIDPSGELAAFCDSTGGWLPLVCTQHVTDSTNAVMERYGWSEGQLDAAVEETSAGCDGLIFLAYLEGERTPNAPNGTGVFLGCRSRTMKPNYEARAVMEGTVLGLNYGFKLIANLLWEQAQIKISRIRATGGGANSRAWRQILADVFDLPVVPMETSQGAAYGAAIQAIWAYACSGARLNERFEISALTSRFIELDEQEAVTPIEENARRYKELYNVHEALSKALRGIPSTPGASPFEMHKRYLDGYVQ